MIYWVLVAGAHAFMYRREANEASELRSQLVQAQLEVLQMQVRPYFLFNTLHTIGTLTRAKETDTAVEMLVGSARCCRNRSRQLDAPRSACVRPRGILSADLVASHENRRVDPSRLLGMTRSCRPG